MQSIKYLAEELEIARLSAGHRLSTLGSPLRKVLVNGCPKSGTTWMVKLLTSLSGYRTVGNFRGDFDRYRNVKPGDVVHGHDPYRQRLSELLAEEDVTVVMITRDPRDQAVSRLHHARRDSTHPFHEDILSMTLDEGLMASIDGGTSIRGVVSSIRFSENWIRNVPDLHVVSYEDLSENTVDQLRTTLNYLGIDLDSKLIRKIVDRNRFERLTVGRKLWIKARLPGEEDVQSHFRKGIVGDWKNHFSQAHKARFKELSGGKLVSMGYEKDQGW